MALFGGQLTEIPQPPFTKIILKITCLKLNWNLHGANELITHGVSLRSLWAAILSIYVHSNIRRTSYRAATLYPGLTMSHITFINIHTVSPETNQYMRINHTAPAIWCGCHINTAFLHWSHVSYIKPTWIYSSTTLTLLKYAMITLIYSIHFFPDLTPI